MKRRGLLQTILAAIVLPFLPRGRVPIESVVVSVAEPITVIDPSARLLMEGPLATETFPFFWDAQVVEGILAVPLLDTLIARDSS